MSETCHMDEAERAARRRAKAARDSARFRARHPGYHAAWSHAHRSTERARKARYRAAHPDKEHERFFREYWARRALVDTTPLPRAFLGDERFVVAEAVVARAGITRWEGLCVRSTSWEDAMGEAVLALVEGRCPEEAVRAWRAREARWAAEHLQPSDRHWDWITNRMPGRVLVGMPDAS